MKGFLILYDDNMKEIKRTSLLKLPLKKDYIGKRSEDMYGEPDPCIIYETAIINRFGLELLEELKKSPDRGCTYDIATVDGILKGVVSLPGEAMFGKFE